MIRKDERRLKIGVESVRTGKPVRLAVSRQGLSRLELLICHVHAMGTRVVSLCASSRDAKDPWKHRPDNDTPEAVSVAAFFPTKVLAETAA